MITKIERERESKKVIEITEIKREREREQKVIGIREIERCNCPCNDLDRTEK